MQMFLQTQQQQQQLHQQSPPAKANRTKNDKILRRKNITNN